MSQKMGETTFPDLIEPRLFLLLLLTCCKHPGSEALWWQRRAAGVFLNLGRIDWSGIEGRLRTDLLFVEIECNDYCLPTLLPLPMQSETSFFFIMWPEAFGVTLRNKQKHKDHLKKNAPTQCMCNSFLSNMVLFVNSSQLLSLSGYINVFLYSL